MSDNTTSAATARNIQRGIAALIAAAAIGAAAIIFGTTAPEYSGNYNKADYWVRDVEPDKIPDPNLGIPYNGIIEAYWDTVDGDCNGVGNYTEFENKLSHFAGTNTYYDGTTSARKFALRIVTEEGSNLRVPNCIPKVTVNESPCSNVTMMDFRTAETTGFIRSKYNALMQHMASVYNSDSRISAIIYGLGVGAEIHPAPIACYAWFNNNGSYNYYYNFLGGANGVIATTASAFSNKVTYYPIANADDYGKHYAIVNLEAQQTTPKRVGIASHGVDWMMPGQYYNINRWGTGGYVTNTLNILTMHYDWPIGLEPKSFPWAPSHALWQMLAGFGLGQYAADYSADYFDGYWPQIGGNYKGVWFAHELFSRSKGVAPKNSTNVWIALRESPAYSACQANPNCYNTCSCILSGKCEDAVNDFSYGIFRAPSDTSLPVTGASNWDVCARGNHLTMSNEAAWAVPGRQGREATSYIYLDVEDNWTGAPPYTVRLWKINNAGIGKFIYKDNGGVEHEHAISSSSTGCRLENAYWVFCEFKNIDIRFNGDYGLGDADLVLSAGGDNIPDIYNIFWIIAGSAGATPTPTPTGPTRTPTPTGTFTPTPTPGGPTSTPTDTPTPTWTPTPTPYDRTTMRIGQLAGKNMDTYISSWNPTSNYWLASEISLRYTGSEAHSGLIQFDSTQLPSAGSVITTATLYLYAGRTLNSNHITTTLYTVSRTNLTWDTTNWNEYAYGSAWGTAGCNNTTSDRSPNAIATIAFNQGAPQWYTANVTSLVQQWVDERIVRPIKIMATGGTASDQAYYITSCEGAGGCAGASAPRIDILALLVPPPTPTDTPSPSPTPTARYGSQTLRVSASTDDADDGSLTGTYLNVDDVSQAGWRFLSLGVPQSADILTATFVITTFAGGVHTSALHAEAADDCVTFNLTNAQPSDRAVTTAYTSMDQSTWTYHGVFSYDVTAQVQEVVNRAGWAEGNDICFVSRHLTGTGKPDARSWDYGSGPYAATLKVDWEKVYPTATPTHTPTNTWTPTPTPTDTPTPTYTPTPTDTPTATFTPTYTPTPLPGPYINEVLVYPKFIDTNGDSEVSDADQFLEIYAGSGVIDVGGMAVVISDTWDIYTSTLSYNYGYIGPDEWIILRPYREITTLPYTNTTIYLYMPTSMDPDTGLLGYTLLDTVVYTDTTLFPDWSYGRSIDGRGVWRWFYWPTMGRANISATPTPTATARQ